MENLGQVSVKVSGEDQSIDRAAAVFSKSIERSVSKVAGGVPGGVGGMMSKVGGMPGLAIGATIGGAVIGLKAAVSTLKKWDRELMESAVRLGRYNGELAVALAKSRFRSIQRDISSASVVGRSLSEGIGLRDDILSNLRPVKDILTLLKSEFFNAALEKIKGKTEPDALLTFANALIDLPGGGSIPFGPIITMLQGFGLQLQQLIVQGEQDPNEDFTSFNENFVRTIEAITGNPVNVHSPGAL